MIKRYWFDFVFEFKTGKFVGARMLFGEQRYTLMSSVEEDEDNMVLQNETPENELRYFQCEDRNTSYTFKDQDFNLISKDIPSYWCWAKTYDRDKEEFFSSKEPSEFIVYREGGRFNEVDFKKGNHFLESYFKLKSDDLTDFIKSFERALKFLKSKT